MEVPASNIKKELARLLKEEGYIQDYEVIEDNKQGMIRLYLKFNGKTVITGLKRISRPGLRVYVKRTRSRRCSEVGDRHPSTSKLLPIKLPASWESEEVLCFVW